MIAYLLTDSALGTGGGHIVVIDLHRNIDGSTNYHDVAAVKVITNSNDTLFQNTIFCTLYKHII
jgi:hypothetical protein